MPFLLKNMLYVLFFTNALTLFSLLYIVYLSHKERSRLLDRIMSRNFEEYTKLTDKPEENDYSDGQEDILDLEEAKNEIMGSK